MPDGSNDRFKYLFRSGRFWPNRDVSQIDPLRSLALRKSGQSRVEATRRDHDLYAAKLDRLNRVH